MEKIKSCIPDDFAMEEWLNDHPDFVEYYLNTNREKFLKIISKFSLSEASLLQNPSLIAKMSENESQDISENREIQSQITDVLEFDAVSKITQEPNTTNINVLSSKFKKLSYSDSFAYFGQEFLLENMKTDSLIKKLERSQDFNENDLLNQMMQDIGNEMNIKNLCYKILQNLCIILKCDRCSLFLIHGEPNDPERCLVAKVFDANFNSPHVEYCRNDEIRIPWGVGIAGYVAKTGETVNISDTYNDERFNSEIDIKTGYKTENILCLPIKKQNGEIIGVAQAINKQSKTEEKTCFTIKDEKIFKKYLIFCAMVIINAQLVEKCVKEIKKNKLLLEFTKTIFEEDESLENIINRILKNVITFVKCESYTFFLLNENKNCSLFSKIVSISNDVENDSVVISEQEISEARIRVLKDVINSGKTANTKSYFSQNKDIVKDDEAIKSYLCVPVTNKNGTVIALVEAINKIPQDNFDAWQQSLLEAIAIFCGISIVNTQVREEYKKSIARQMVSIEILSYHANIFDEDINELLARPIPSTEELNLLDFAFDDSNLKDIDTCLAIIRMFYQLEFLSNFKIDLKLRGFMPMDFNCKKKLSTN